MDAIIISGLLINLNDNIVPFIEGNDVFVHTWNTKDNQRWITKLERYRKHTNSLNIIVEKPKYDKKLYSYFYSTTKAVRSIPDIDKYKRLIKFKPNLLLNEIVYEGFLEHYFHKAYISSRPLLTGYSKEDCIYGAQYYKTLDERLFSGYPLAFKKLFHILDYRDRMLELNSKLESKYGEDYEGSIFWTEWCEANDVPIITDLKLKIPNNVK